MEKHAEFDMLDTQRKPATEDTFFASKPQQTYYNLCWEQFQVVVFPEMRTLTLTFRKRACVGIPAGLP
jgi:hypothetical protein